MARHGIILGAGMYVPEKVIDNQYFVDRNPYYRYDMAGNQQTETVDGREVVQTVETSDEWIVTRMGVHHRRALADGETVVDLAERAARPCLTNAHVAAEELEGIIIATVSNQMRFPSVACVVQERLGARKATVCYDLAAACAGFPLALQQANLMMGNGCGPYLVIGAEALWNIVDFTDLNSPLFGNGAGAVLLGPSEAPEDECRGVLAFVSSSDPFDGKAMWICQDSHGFLRMPEGTKVMRAAVRGMYEVTCVIKERIEWKTEDVDLYIPHQANQRITDGYLKELGVPAEKVSSTIGDYGNMSAATNPVAFAEAYQRGRIRRGSKVVMVALGSGVVCSGVGLVV